MCWPDCTGVQTDLPIYCFKNKPVDLFSRVEGETIIHLITFTIIIDGYQIKRRGSGFVDAQADLHLYYFIFCILEALFDELWLKNFFEHYRQL